MNPKAQGINEEFHISGKVEISNLLKGCIPLELGNWPFKQGNL